MDYGANSVWKELGRPKSLRQQVADQIINALALGHLKPGQRIVELELAQNLGISRAPIREALIQLEQEGLVHVVPYKGTYVMDLNYTGVWELYTLRAVLEEFAIRRVMESNIRDTITSLWDIYDKMIEVCNTGNKLQMAELDSKFHEIIVRGADHEQLYRAWYPLKYKYMFYTITIDKNYSSSLEIVVKMHEKLIETMENGEVEKAVEEIKSHIIETGKLLLSQVADHGI
ncbi:GntR family transcriptional regulator [Ammoniphilus resinae]|uniref:DNA-binding GntR family transcriptional regulator n=1 Tax=Ammoniphilus resinae TaxID=861532 RepID=A0ABS4GWC1_9BACL|nr:GntR family transcriptional regulator [Ammoniphilus resinae]MBP1934551.1 DNA-binding GntR family transcriptional regulator [Ammoniphilus resinae]